VWTGAIQAAPVASSGAAAGAPASRPQAPVSSIQELLALKNRVLMALQKHGIGTSAQSGANGPSAAAPANGGAAAPVAGTAGGAKAGEAAWLPSAIGIVAAIVAVVLLLLIRVMMRRRKPQAAQPPSGDGDAAVSRAATSGEPTPADTPGQMTDAAGFAAASSLGADALPPTVFETPHGAPVPAEEDVAAEPERHDVRTHDEPQPRGVEPGEPETLANASDTASLEAAASLGADALPPESIEAARLHAQEAHDAEEPEQAAPHVEPAQPPADETAQHDDEPQHPPHEPPAADELAQHPPQEPTPTPEPDAAPDHATPPTEFPADAAAALDALDMPLPQRVGEPAGVAPSPTGPVASFETIERQSLPLDEPPAPPAGGEIEAGTSGAGSIAGLGAARFGTLSLDFDLNLPPDSADPLPVFTPEQLARIARNKLELAQEYIALGDLTGARTLINEVIESNDHATRADAQALLATLAPLS